jgi:hypothetical protein
VRERSYPADVTDAPSNVDPHVPAIGPTQACKRLSERSDVRFRHVFVAPRYEHADAPHAVALLRACRERPHGRAAEERDELAASFDHLVSDGT